MSNQKPIWGIDMGGTKIEGVVLPSAQSVEPICRLRVPTESTKGYPHVIGQFKTLIDQMKAETGLNPNAIGIGMPGAYDPVSKVIKNANAQELNGKDLKSDLEAALGVRIELANDANCFALAEAKLGAVPERCPEAQMVFGVIMGSGVGGGIVVDGKVWNGRMGIAGEWGNNVIEPDGPPSKYGTKGTVEAYISGWGLEQYYAQIAGERRTLREVSQQYESGEDPHARATMDRLVQYFGKTMASLINILDPDAIVLGGGVGNIGLLYTEGVKEVSKHVFNPRLDTVFLKPKLGDSAGVFGAAMLVAE